MSDPVLERSVLERKERDELQTIAKALGAKPLARAKKADLVDLILATAGIVPTSDNTNANANANANGDGNGNRTAERPPTGKRVVRSNARAEVPDDIADLLAEEESLVDGVTAEATPDVAPARSTPAPETSVTDDAAPASDGA